MSKTGGPSFGDRRSGHGFARESLGFTVAEGVSMGVSLMAVGVADAIAPNAVKSATRVVAKKLIEPRLDFIERNMQKVCHIEECQADETRSRQERAESLARALVLFTPAWFLSMGAKIWTRRKMNEHYNIKDPVKSEGHRGSHKFMSPYEWKIFLADEGVHYGSMIYMNTSGAEYTNDLIKATSTMLQKQTGMSKRKADDLSSMAVVWELPNVLGLAAGLGVIGGKHKFGWFDRRGHNPPHNR